MKKQCNRLTKHGLKCHNQAIISGMCLPHWKMMKNKEERKKVKKIIRKPKGDMVV